MKQTKKDDRSVAKGVLFGAAVLAGIAAIITMKDEKTRKKVESSLADMRVKGMELKTKATDWVQDHPIQDALDESLTEKNPVKKVARVIATE